jgi:hypothetical protein
MRDASGNFSAGTITATLSAGSVGNTQLAHNAVQTVNILDASVTSAKISNGAIGSLALEAAAVTPSKLAPDCAVFLEEAATVDSSSGSSGIGWEVRKLNGGRVFPATGGSISRSGNTITLQPGTYYVSAEAAVGDIYQNQLILRDVTTGTGGIPNGAQAVIRGMSGVSNGGSSPNSLKGIITVGATAKNFELWHYTGTYSPSLDGFGQATSGGPDPRYGTEILPIYCQIAIIRLQ